MWSKVLITLWSKAPKHAGFRRSSWDPRDPHTQQTRDDPLQKKQKRQRKRCALPKHLPITACSQVPGFTSCMDLCRTHRGDRGRHCDKRRHCARRHFLEGNRHYRSGTVFSFFRFPAFPFSSLADFPCFRVPAFPPSPHIPPSPFCLQRFPHFLSASHISTFRSDGFPHFLSAPMAPIIFRSAPVAPVIFLSAPMAPVIVSRPIQDCVELALRCLETLSVTPKPSVDKGPHLGCI